jgi:hypothetical protein
VVHSVNADTCSDLSNRAFVGVMFSDALPHSRRAHSGTSDVTAPNVRIVSITRDAHRVLPTRRFQPRGP